MYMYVYAANNLTLHEIEGVYPSSQQRVLSHSPSLANHKWTICCTPQYSKKYIPQV
jgi:hypothetical protein